MSQKYKELLSQSESQKDQQELEFKVEEAKQQLAQDQLATKKELARVKRELNIAKSSFPLESAKIIELQNEIEAYEKGLSRLEELEKELF